MVTILTILYVTFLRPAISIDAKQWDATKLPFPDGHVDVFITDMVR